MFPSSARPIRPGGHAYGFDDDTRPTATLDVLTVVADPFATSTTGTRPLRPTGPSPLLDGLQGRSGFLFHAHNQPVLQAAPGLLGLIEGRLVIGRWKPASQAWLDNSEHFVKHLYGEFGGYAGFEAVRREIDTIVGVDASWPARNACLFQYLGALTRELERAALPSRRGAKPPVELDGQISLNGIWTVRYRSGEDWVQGEMAVPGNWELVPGIDDYAGTMRFTRTFPSPAPGDGALALRFAGVDYFADVWLNGYHLGGHEGYFEPFELDATPYLRGDGEQNVLRVAVTSPNEPSGSGTHVTSGWHDFSATSAFPNRKTLIKGTLGHHDAKRGGAWSSITSQDGNTGGIWGDVVLRARGALHVDPSGIRVTTLSTTPDRTAAGSYRVASRTDVTVGNATTRTFAARIRVLVEPIAFEGATQELAKTARLAPGTNRVTVAGTLSPLQLWHPIDHGDPRLYKVTVVVDVDGMPPARASVETGFRTLAVSPIGESTGAGGAFVVNGHRVFVRGTNLLPTYWLSEYSEERVERDFELLHAAGFNGVLIHNLVAPRHFYERANRHGFLVVQMFTLQWSYDQSHEVVQSMTDQIRAMAGLFVNDPCVVSYEVHNEPDMSMSDGIDNRLVDFDLHAVVRDADPTRWATTFSSGNHAYPGQFYPLRDDNGFATLPGRFLEEEVHGRRISRHRNMPTEFGIQAMPDVALFRELVSEDRVRSVLERIRTDPKWVAAGADSWAEATKTLDEAKQVLGRGTWKRTLETFDWALLWDLGELAERIRRAEAAPVTSPHAEAERLALKLAVLLLDVLHYGGFKGENFWFGLWRPASTLEGFVASGQNRQYRLHKDAIESYLDAGATGPIVGYFSFMFRDADWEAPTWGIVDAAWTPKKAYRAYLESNHAVRVTLPAARCAAVKLPGDPWLAEPAHAGGYAQAGAAMIVANDTAEPVPGAEVTLWVEDGDGVRLDLLDDRQTFDLPAGAAVTAGLDGAGGTVAEDVRAGTYFIRARVSTATGETLSTNGYEVVVPDTTFPWLDRMSSADVSALLDGAPGVEGFHYWHGGTVTHRAHGGLRGFLAGWSHAETQGIDLYETVQGEHLFRHLLQELAQMDAADRLCDDIWTIRSEIVSPAVKSATLLRYVELVVRRAEDRPATGRRRSPRSKPAAAAAPAPAAASPAFGGGPPPAPLFPAVGRDVRPAGPTAHPSRRSP